MICGRDSLVGLNGPWRWYFYLHVRLNEYLYLILPWFIEPLVSYDLKGLIICNMTAGQHDLHSLPL